MTNLDTQAQRPDGLWVERLREARISAGVEAE